jgi:flagellar motor switch protein FliM
MSAVLYDFTKPGRFAGEWQHRLGAWFRLAFAAANKRWAKELPVAIDGAVTAVDVGYAGKCLAALPEGTVGFRVQAASGRVPTFLTLPRLSLLRVISVMLGDTASASADRELTLIEENLADYFLVQYWLPFFREAWPAAELVAWELQQRESNPQASRFFPAEESLVVLNWRLRGPWGEDAGAWFFQKRGLFEALGDKAGTAAETIPPPALAARREAIVHQLPLVVEFVLGSAELKLSQLSQLRVGDVVLLDQGTEGMVARTGGQNLFRGQAGRLGSRKAFQVTANGKS